MKVCLLASNFLPKIGGAELVIHNLALNLLNKGIDVYVLTPRSAKQVLNIKNNGLPYKVLPLLRKSNRWFANSNKLGVRLVELQLFLYQKIFRFDVWHVQTVFGVGAIAPALIKKMKTPVICTCHGEDIQTMRDIGYGYRLNSNFDKSIRSAIHDCNKAIAISDSIRDEYLTLGLSRDKIVDLPNGIDVQRFKQLVTDKCSIRNKMGWDSDKFIILTVGRNHPKKGYRLIPEIIKEIAQKRQDFIWVILGSNCESIVKEADKMGVGSFISAPGLITSDQGTSELKKYTLPSNSLIELYKNADIYANPTFLESFSLVNFEAMSSGLPVASTDAPGCRDNFIDEETALVSRTADTSGMARNILRLMSEPSLRSHLIKNCLIKVDDFDWSRVVDLHIKLYKTVANK